MQILMEKLILLPGIIIGLSFHEFGHAVMAYLMGDDTAQKSGRLTVEPLSHIDPVGFLMLMIAGFGWAKPVPINENKFRKKNLGLFLVSIAGVTMNLILAILFFLIYYFTEARVNLDAYSQVMYGIVMINIGLACFNLLPLPPLDGSKIVYSFLPLKWRYRAYQYENYGTIILMVLLVTGTIGYFLRPIQHVIYGMINAVLNFILP